jgi:hypothetical protein
VQIHTKARGAPSASAGTDHPDDIIGSVQYGTRNRIGAICAFAQDTVNLGWVRHKALHLVGDRRKTLHRHFDERRFEGAKALTGKAAEDGCGVSSASAA